MKKFVNHIDHVAWISRPENIEKNVAKLEEITGANMEKFEREDMGFVMYIDWAMGLEMVAPLAYKTDFNQMLYDWLDTRGEGINSVVFGVRGLEEHKERLEKLGYTPGPIMDNHPDSPWAKKLSLYERVADEFMGSLFILGDIDYEDGLIKFEDT